MKPRYNGPTCGRKYRVNRSLESFAVFLRSQERGGWWQTWVGDRKWHGRYRALKRSRMAHGHNAEQIDLLVRVSQEWRAASR